MADAERSARFSAPETGPGPARRPRLLVLDAAYTLEMIRDRGQERSILSRDLDGYFDHVWNVHPFATLLSGSSAVTACGPPIWHELGPRHTFVEGQAGRFRALRALFPINFLIGQAALLLQLRNLVKREGISAIRAGDPLYLGLFGWALARLTGAAFLIRVNGNNDKVRETTGKPIFPRLLRSAKLEKRIERFVFPRADLIFAPNENNADFAVANGARRDATRIVNFGSLLGEEHFAEPAARPSAAADLEALGLEANNFLLCIGRLEQPKYPDHVIETLAEVRALRPGLKALFVGDGTLREELRRLAERLGVAESVAFAGNRDQQFLSRIIPEAAVVLSPSTGRALSEAALGAVPVVAYDTDWQKDMVETGVTGILVPYRDRKAMAEATARLLRDPGFAREMGAAIRRRALAMLDPQAGMAAERKAYQGLFARLGGGKETE
ncbi:MAG TPA: glycosyltransferase [Allosphingosinicella sp.]|nr:glycosyltransferase [Allosphingosinicella sp.]